MTRFEVGLPITDAAGNNVNVTALAANMETLASDGQTHAPGQDTRWSGGNFIDQCNVFFWNIPDVDLTTAQSYYSSFIAGFSFSNAPYAHNWSIA